MRSLFLVLNFSCYYALLKTAVKGVKGVSI